MRDCSASAWENLVVRSTEEKEALQKVITVLLVKFDQNRNIIPKMDRTNFLRTRQS